LSPSWLAIDLCGQAKKKVLVISSAIGSASLIAIQSKDLREHILPGSNSII
jgi:hypothetical protein